MLYPSGIQFGALEAQRLDEYGVSLLAGGVYCSEYGAPDCDALMSG